MSNWPVRVNEAGNGALFLMLAFGVLYLASFLARNAWADGRLVKNSVNKAAFGMLTAFTGFAVKSAGGWWALHVLHESGKIPESPYLSAAFGGGTLIAMWGVACTVNALAPYEWGRASQLFFGFATAMFAVLLFL